MTRSKRVSENDRILTKRKYGEIINDDGDKDDNIEEEEEDNLNVDNDNVKNGIDYVGENGAPNNNTGTISRKRRRKKKLTFQITKIKIAMILTYK